MGLTLKWDEDYLMLGHYPLAAVTTRTTGMTTACHLGLDTRAQPAWAQGTWESADDARQDVGQAVAAELRALGAGTVRVEGTVEPKTALKVPPFALVVLGKDGALQERLNATNEAAARKQATAITTVRGQRGWTVEIMRRVNGSRTLVATYRNGREVRRGT